MNSFAKYILTVATRPVAFCLDAEILSRVVAALDMGIPFQLSDLGIPDRNMKAVVASVNMAEGSSSGKKKKSGQVYVQHIHGVMTKDDGWCGEVGTLTIAENLRQADDNPNIAAIVLDISSPGGEAAGLDTLYNTVRSIEKPVLAYVNEMALSGGYYAAVGADEVWLSGKAAQTGSIGTVLEYYDMTRRMQEAGIDPVSITATKSTEKRALNFRQPKEADMALIRERMLDPINEVFLESVTGARTQVKPEALKGRVFHGDESIRHGLADNYATLRQVVARAFSLH